MSTTQWLITMNSHAVQTDLLVCTTQRRRYNYTSAGKLLKNMSCMFGMKEMSAEKAPVGCFMQDVV